MKDQYNFEMEDLGAFPFERSADYDFWEAVSDEELNQILEALPRDKARTFVGVVRNGSSFLLNDFHYRIKPRKASALKQ